VLIRDFYDCIKENKPFWIDGESALPVLKMLKGVYSSSATHEEIKL